VQGEQLYDFLERQVGDQMRTALGAPLQNVSENILNRVISKSIQADLKKYKMGGGKKGERATSNGRERTKSPAARRAAYVADDYEATLDAGSLGDLSKEVSHYLSSLNTSTQNKLSLIKMSIIKCDESSNLYAKMRQCLNHGDMDEADHILAILEESNHQLQLDCKNEVSDGPKVSASIGMLCE